MGFETVKTDSGPKNYESLFSQDNLLNYRYPFCDLFLMSREHGNLGKKFVLSYRQARVIWPQESYPAQDVEEDNCQDRTFGDFTLKVSKIYFFFIFKLASEIPNIVLLFYHV